jgi:hypothetical protein
VAEDVYSRGADRVPARRRTLLVAQIGHVNEAAEIIAQLALTGASRFIHKIRFTVSWVILNRPITYNVACGAA